MSLVAVPRELVPWYPTIDADACIGDRVCVDFCKNDVYRWDEESAHPVVERPHNCVLGCSACMDLCPVSAISFPSMQELREPLRRLRTQAVAQIPAATAAPPAGDGRGVSMTEILDARRSGCCG
jgi:NAD-dependent dihydropyrimidine dehydrogenase PreA subunit